jgi:16S rRNA (guanine966-N2)-methyltransferase
MLSVMGGAWSGRKLKALDKEDLRPTLGRVKAAIFSILESIEWKRSGQPDFSAWRCLDLFAGVGSLGIEVLSRGAASCVFVEKNRQHAKILKENLSSVGADALAKVLLGGVEEGAWEKEGPFHLVLIDPPYKNSLLPDLLTRLAAPGVLTPGGIVVFEHDPKFKQAPVAGLSLHSQRVLGPAGITVLLRDPY